MTKSNPRKRDGELAACKTLGCADSNRAQKRAQRECARPIVVAKSILERSRASGAAVGIRKAQIAECLPSCIKVLHCLRLALLLGSW